MAMCSDVDDTPVSGRFEWDRRELNSRFVLPAQAVDAKHIESVNSILL